MAKLTVKEYSDAHGRTTQGVYQLIRRHEKEMKAHMKKIGGKLVIDEAGQALLDEWSAKLQAQIPTMAIVEAPHLEDEYREAQEKILRLTEEKAALQEVIIQKQEQILQLMKQNGALQVQLLEAKQPAKEPEPGLFDQEDGPADQTPDEGPSDLYDPDNLEPDPEPIRRAAVADPGEGEKKKGFFARLFGL